MAQSFLEKYGQLAVRQQPAQPTLTPRQEEPNATIGEMARDYFTDIAKGVVGFGEAVVGLGDLATFNLVGKGLEKIGYDPNRTRQILESGYSDERKQELAEVRAAEGFLNTVVASVTNPGVAVGTIFESAPMMLGAAGAVRAAATRILAAKGVTPALGATEYAAQAAKVLSDKAVRAQLATAGAAAEGALGAGAIQEASRQEGRGFLESAPAAVGGGLATAAIGKVAGSIGFGDLETAVGTAGLPGATAAAGRNRLLEVGKTIAKDMFQEGFLEELPQSASEQVFTNLAMGRPWAEGVPEAAATGLITGAGMGGGVGLLRGAQRPAPEVRLTEATTASDAVQAAADMVDLDIEALEREAGLASAPPAAGTQDLPAADFTQNLAAGRGLLQQAMPTSVTFGQEPVAGPPEPTLTLQRLEQADTRSMAPEDRTEFVTQLNAARLAQSEPVRQAALTRAAEVYGRTVGPIQDRAPAAPAAPVAPPAAPERMRTEGPSLQALEQADTRSMDAEDRTDFVTQLNAARLAQSEPVRQAALARAAEVYGRAVGPIQPIAPTQAQAQPGAATRRTAVPRPTKLLDRPTSQYTESQLEALIANENTPAVTKRGAEVELRARAELAPTQATGAFAPTMAPTRAYQETDGKFLSIPEAVPVVAAQPVAGQSAGQQARAAAQRAMDAWAASRGVPSPAKFADPSPELEANVAEIADLIGSQWGGRVVAFSDTSPNAINGVAVGKIAYVNVGNTQAGVQRTALHEFKHTVEQIAKAEAAAGLTDTPAQDFVEQIDSVFDDMTDEGKRAYLENFLAAEELATLQGPAREARIQELLVDPELRSEMTADFLGNRATDKQFWQDIAKADPTGFEGFVKRWLAAVDNLLAKLRGAKGRTKKESARVDTYIRDLNKAKMVAQSALINYRKATQGVVALPQQEATLEQDNAARASRVQATARQTGPEARGAGRGPEYGTPVEGAVSVDAVHYSSSPRESLSGAYYGTGAPGAESSRLRGPGTAELRNRIYFYVDTGNGTRPERGVGAVAHRVRLNNLYDVSTGKIRAKSVNAFEKAVIAAGYDGYLDRDFGTQGAAVLLGSRHSAVPVAREEAPAFSRREPRPNTVSQRTPPPKSGRSDPHLTSDLAVNLDALEGATAFKSKLAAGVKNYRLVNIRARNPDAVLERFVEHAKDNILWLFDQVPENIRNRSKLWYVGGNALAKRFAAKHGGEYTVPQMAGVMAAMSPKMVWDVNVSLAERIVDIFTTKQNAAWTDRMAEIGEAKLESNPNWRKYLDAIRGKKLKDLQNDVHAALWVVLYDSANNSSDYRLVSPEGDFLDFAENADGSRAKASFANGLGPVAKSIRILRDGAIPNISRQLGEKHKVRNFYNNLVDPEDPSSVTIDTHAVAAALLLPLGQSSLHVEDALGKLSGSASAGLSGSYVLYAEAYHRAAKERGVLAREMQSITWEALRGLYTPAAKTRYKRNPQILDDLVAQFYRGEIDEKQFRDGVLEVAGGRISPPRWVMAPARTDAGGPGSSYEGGVPRGRGAERADGVRRGVRVRAGAADVPSFSRRQQGDGGREGGRGVQAGQVQAPEQAALEGAPVVPGATGPDPALVAVAEQYAQDNGIPYSRQSEYVEVDEDLARRIADAYERMPHAPNDPQVEEAYQDLIRQTRAQYDALVSAGYRFWFTDDSSAEYLSSPWNAMRELRASKTMGVFPTVEGFGSGDLDVANNPLLQNTGLRWPVGSPDSDATAPVLANDLFRAVHDAFGHGLEGAGFRGRGEENAWQAHARLFTGPALGALTTETRGQNSWLNYGPNGEANRSAAVQDTVFAEQKTGLMPEWTWREKGPRFSRAQADVAARIPELERAAQGIKEGTVTREQYEELVNALKPVTPYEEVPAPATEADIRRGLSSDKLNRIGVPSKTLKAGDPVGLRLDIPAYINQGVWVVSVHEQDPGFAAGKSIGYESVAAVTNPTFGMPESGALNIAAGKSKAPIAVMKGDWKPTTPKQAFAAAKLALKSKNWVQVGMDPTRHAYFYDRASMEPVVSADEAIQVGPLVLAKNPVYGDKADFRFSRSQTLVVNGVQRPTTNSEGRPIAQSEEALRNFWQWFGDSKGVDPQGRPKLYYHSTTKDFEAFDPEKSSHLGGASFFYADKKRMAAESQVAGDVVYPVYLKMSAPSNVDWKGKEYDGQKVDTAISRAIANGRDSLIIHNMLDDGSRAAQFVVFEPTQIKSAIGNRGTFDPNDPRINFSRSQAPADSQVKRVMYHGTGEQIDKFKAGRAGAIFFSETPDYANLYATGRAPNVVPVYLDVKNLFDFVDNPEHRALAIKIFNESGGWAETTEGERSDYDPAQDMDWEIFDEPNVGLMQQVRDLGYDGIRFRENEDTVAVAVFDGSQVISAIGGPDVRFSRAQVNTPEFKRWFGDSKVVDENGEPLVVYHGTAGSFEAFQPFIEGRTEGASELRDAGVPAFFFTDSLTVAEGFAEGAEREGADAKVLSTYLSITKPYVIYANGDGWPNFQKEIIDAYESGAHDGVILYRVSDGMFENDISTVYVAFEPTQIKSATDNRGTFDPNDPRISFSRAQVNTPEFKRWFGNSKVVDENGEPLVVYRGAATDEGESFDRNKDYIYASTSAAYANNFAEGENGANVSPLYMSLKNPLDLTPLGLGRVASSAFVDFLSAAGVSVDSSGMIPGLRSPVWAFLKNGSFKKEIEAAGYDGIILDERISPDFKGSTRRGRSYVAFKPTQIKSAIGNRGTFDPNDPRITFSRAQQNPMKLYSALSKAAQQGPVRAPAAQWKGLLRKSAKPEEITWSGVEDWLDLQEGNVPREAVSEFLAQNGVQVGEVVSGKPPWRVYNPDIRQGFSFPTEAEARAYAEANDVPSVEVYPEAETIDTQYAQYQLPGGKNYREVLITLPAKQPDEKRLEALRQRMRDQSITPEEREEYGQLAAAAQNFVKSTYQSSHWSGVPNVLAHIRMNDRVDADGARVLFVEELQSDWAQEAVKARKKEVKRLQREEGISKEEANARVPSDFGFQPRTVERAKPNPYRVAQVPTERQYVDSNGRVYSWAVFEGNTLVDGTYQTEEDAIARMEEMQPIPLRRTIQRVPRAPFVQTTDSWLNLALKRVITMAVEEGYDKIAFINGEQSADRYDLSAQISSLYITRSTPTGDYEITAYGIDNVRVLSGKRAKDIDEVEALIGKEMAQKVADMQPGDFERRFSGLDLKVGGEGMKAFYDSIVPKAVAKLLPKIGGGKLETVSIDTQEKGLTEKREYVGPEHTAETVADVEDEYRDNPLGSVRVASQLRSIRRAIHAGQDYAEAIAEHGSLEAAELLGGDLQRLDSVISDQTGFAITREMTDQVMDAGLPMFSRRQNIFGQPMPAGGWQVGDSRLDEVIYYLQDKLVDTKRVIESISKTVGQIADKFDAYLQETLYHGRVSTRTTDFADNEIKPLIESMKRNNVTIDQIDEYLHNRHAEERNLAMAKRDPNQRDGLSGITTADAKAYLAAIPPARRALLEGLARRVDAITAGTRKALLEAGLESQGMLDAWENTYSAYVPLMREELDYDPAGGPGTGAGFNVRGSASRRAVGSPDRKVVDILANVVMQRERAIVRAEKNRVSKALYGLAIQNPLPDFWLPVNLDAAKDPAALQAELISLGLSVADAQNIAQQPKERVVDPRTGMVTERPNHRLLTSANVITARVNGKDRFLILNPQNPRAERMALALKNLDVDQLGRAMGLVAQGTRWFASVNTQYNPIFGVINFLRDVQGGLLNLSSTELAGKQKQVVADTLPALRGIYSGLRSRGAAGQWAQLWREFQETGGQTGYRDQFSQSEDRARALQKEIDAITAGTVKKAGKAIGQWLSDYNTAMENAVRLSAYKAGLDKGMSKERAAALAKNLTVNFNKKGQVATQMGALYAFFNASVQGTTRLAQTLAGPAGKKIIYGGLLLGSAQALVMAMAGFDEEEPPDFTRERSLIIPTGDGKYLTIPMPLGFNVIPNFSRIVTEWALSGFERTPQRVTQIATSFFEMFNPIGSAGLSIQTLAPTVVDPFAALAENRDWTGTPIAREDFNSLDPTPGYTRAKDTASEFSKALAEFLNLASGGTEFAPGVISPTPDQLDYFLGQIAGGIGREYLKAEQTITSTVTGEELPTYKIPLVGRFIGDTAGSSAVSSRFYETIRRMNIHNNEIGGRREAGKPVGEYLRENPEARLAPQALRVYRQVQDLRRRKREMLERDASKESIRMIEKQITRRMQQFNDRIDRM